MQARWNAGSNVWGRRITCVWKSLLLWSVRVGFCAIASLRESHHRKRTASLLLLLVIVPRHRPCALFFTYTMFNQGAQAAVLADRGLFERRSSHAHKRAAGLEAQEMVAGDGVGGRVVAPDFMSVQ